MAAEIISIIAGLIMLFPVFVVILNAFKPFKTILTDTFALPTTLYLDNLKFAWDQMKYPRILSNTIFCALLTVSITTVLSAMCGYMLSRSDDVKSRFFLKLLMASMIIPFQSIMLPVYKIAFNLKLGDSLIGYVLILIPLYAPFAVFVYHGFVKGVPFALEESAIIDGCGPYRRFFIIVFPLLKGTTASIVVLFTLWVWNDYTLPSLLLRSAENRTLTSSVYAFFSSYFSRWDYGIASLALALFPITIFFVFMQKYFISGMIAGAVKG